MALIEGYQTLYGLDRSGGRLIAVRLRGRTVREVQVPSQEWNNVLSNADHPRTAFVVALPVRDSLAQWVKAPFASRSKARRVFPSILDSMLPFPVESCTVRFLKENREDSGGVETLALAVRHEALDALLASWQDEGLEPEWVAHEGWTLWAQALAEKTAVPGRLRIIAHWTADRLVLVLGRGSRMEGAYNIGTSEDDGQTISANAIDRIRRVLRVRWQQGTAEGWEWAWSGANAENHDRREHLLRQLNAPDELQTFVFEDPATFLARALVLQRTRNTGGINFRDQAREHPKTIAYRRRRSAKLAAAVLTIGIVLCVLNILAEQHINRHDTEIQEALTGNVRRLTGAERIPRGYEVDIARQYMGQERERLKRLKQFFEPAAGYWLAQIMQIAGQKNIYIDSLALTAQRVEIRGSVGAVQDIGLLQRYFSEQGFHVEAERRESETETRTGFLIRGVRHEG